MSRSGRAQVTVTGPAAADVAWERYARPALWPGWAPQIRSVDYSLDRLRAGTSGVVHAVPGLRVPFTVEEVDEEGRRWSWRVDALGVRLRMTHTVGPCSAAGRHPAVDEPPAGSSTTLQVTGPPGIVHAYALFARWPLRRLLRPGA